MAIVIKDQIKKFIELQKIDAEVYKIKKDLDVIPQKIAEIEEELDRKKSRLKSLEEHHKELQVKRKEMELELQEMDSHVLKGTGQLMQLKTNKEYSAKIAEIEGIKADKSMVEDKLLEVMEAFERSQQEIQEEKTRLVADEQLFADNKKVIDAEAEAIQKRIEESKQGRGALNAEVDGNLRAQYERILERKQGVAIVPVLKGNKCGGCYMNLTQQKINEIRAYKDLVHCENCVRIIYLEEDLDLPNG